MKKAVLLLAMFGLLAAMVGCGGNSWVSSPPAGGEDQGPPLSAWTETVPGMPGISHGVFVHYPRGFAKGGGGAAASGDQVNDYKYTGIHWVGANPRITFLTNPANSEGLAEADVAAVVRVCFNTWQVAEAADGNVINFIDGGLTTVNTPARPPMDGLNTVSFEPISSVYPSAIAVTNYWYYTLSKQLVEADTLLNADFAWSINPYGATGFTTFDVQDITTHELGHWLVLGDLYKPRDSELTMYGYGSTGETKKDTLGKGDITGINRIY